MSAASLPTRPPTAWCGGIPAFFHGSGYELGRPGLPFAVAALNADTCSMTLAGWCSGASRARSGWHACDLRCAATPLPSPRSHAKRHPAIPDRTMWSSRSTTSSPPPSAASSTRHPPPPVSLHQCRMGPDGPHTRPRCRLPPQSLVTSWRHAIRACAASKACSPTKARRLTLLSHCHSRRSHPIYAAAGGAPRRQLQYVWQPGWQHGLGLWGRHGRAVQLHQRSAGG